MVLESVSRWSELLFSDTGKGRHRGRKYVRYHYSILLNYLLRGGSHPLPLFQVMEIPYLFLSPRYLLLRLLLKQLTYHSFICDRSTIQSANGGHHFGLISWSLYLALANPWISGSLSSTLMILKSVQQRALDRQESFKHYDTHTLFLSPLFKGSRKRTEKIR